MVAPLVSKSKSEGRWSESGSLRFSTPASASRMTSAAMTILVRLAIANCEPTSTGCTPSAVPAAPDHTPPLATSTVAVIPGSPRPPSTAASRTACRAVAVSMGRGPVGTSGKCPRLYAPSAGDGEGSGVAAAGLGLRAERVGLELVCIGEAHAPASSPMATSVVATFRRCEARNSDGRSSVIGSPPDGPVGSRRSRGPRLEAVVASVCSDHVLGRYGFEASWMELSTTCWAARSAAEVSG